MVDYYEKSRHHISITDASTADVLGFTVARKNGELAYQEHDGKFLADQFFSDAATQSNLDPEKELLLGQSDWRSGFGLSIYDPNDPKRYESSYGADLRFKDRGMLSYGATAIAMPTVTASWQTPASAAGADFDTPANAIDGNTGTDATDDVNINTWSGYLTAQCSAYGTQCRVWVSSESSDVDYWDVAIYESGAWRTVHDASAITEGQWVTIAYSASYAVTQIRIRGHVKAAAAGWTDVNVHEVNVEQDYNDVAISTRGVTFNDLEYIPIGNILYKLNTTGDGFTEIARFSHTITQLVPMTISNTDYLFIFIGFNAKYWYMTTGESLTQSTATVNTLQYAQVVNTTTPTMYANDTNSTIRSTTDPLNGGTAWSAQTQVGVDFYDILDLFTTSGALYIRKEDKPYYLNSAGAVQNDLAPECEPMAADTTGRAVLVWQNEVFYVAGLSSLVRIGDTNSWISPSEYCTNLEAFTGQIFALAGDDRYLIAIVDNSPDILSDTFEWGVDADSLSTSGGSITWTVAAAGTSRAEIDTAQKYAGTRSARLYRDGTNNPEAYFTQTASTDYNIQFRMRKDETSLFYFSHGNGTKRIYIQVSAGELIYYYDTAWRATGSSVSINTWYLFEIRNINWTAGTYDIYLDDVLIQSGAVMETSGSNSNKIDFLNSQGTSELWIDNIEVYEKKVEVMFGRDENVEGTTAWRWHPYQEIPLTACNITWVSSVYQKRAWIASNTYGESLYYIPLPDNYGNVENDTNRSFATGGYFTTPFLHGNFKETTKGLISVSASLGHAYDVDIYWECHYKKLGDTSWTDLGDLKGTATDRTHTLYRTTSTTSPMFQYKFVGVTDDTTKTPILLGYTAKLIMYPTIRKLIFCTVRVGDGVTDKAGLTMSNKTVLQKTCLDNARNASWLVTFTDLDGTSLKGKFLPLPSGTPRRVPVKDEKGRTIEWEYNLLIMVVNTS